jgi:hypothetical protein
MIKSSPAFIAAVLVLALGASVASAQTIAPPPNLWTHGTTKIVRRNAENYLVTAVSIHLAYHFEDHPITPSRSR